MINSNNFTEAIKKLNSQQQTAVTSIEGPVMVVAGPGTGKTQILTLRIANILYQTDQQPENILALTFTDSAVKAMRERLRHYLGPLAYRVPLYTFHGFAQRLITDYPEAFPHIIGGRPATDIEKVEIIESILDDNLFTILRPIGNPTYYVPSLLSMISDLKQSYISPNDLSGIIAGLEHRLTTTERIHQSGAHKGKVRGEYNTLEKQISKNRELLAVYQRYVAAFTTARLYDFDDMITESVSALSQDENLLRDLQETYQYILADEHQDVNTAQNKIIEKLCDYHEQPNIFVVGDEKQAIYRFQGASLENFLYFTSIFPHATEISLNDNYRSGQNILDLAQAIITVPDETIMQLRTPLRAHHTTGGEVTVRIFSHQAVEDDWLVTEVKDALARGVPAPEIAIIVRTNQEVESLAVRLRQAEVSVTASAEGDILEHPILQAIEGLIQTILSPADEVSLSSVLQSAYWGISTNDIVRLMRARTYETPLSLLIADESRLRSLDVKEPASILRVNNVITEARARALHEPPHRVLEYILDASGFLNHTMAHDPFDGARVTRRIYDEIEALVIRDGISTLSAVRRLLALRRTYRLPLSAPYLATGRESVVIMTAHKAKGLEYDVVFIPHLVDTHWGGRAHRRNFAVPLEKYTKDLALDPLDDERRLLFVACTRAKSQLFLSGAERSIQGKDVPLSRLIMPLIDNGQLKQVDTKDLEATFSPIAALTGTAHNEARATMPIITELLQTNGLSATSLNNLLTNPWQFLFRNLLRVPEVKPLRMQFGTAIHEVLERTTAEFSSTKIWPTPARLLEWLKQELNRLPLSTSEYTALHEKGSAILAPYLDHLKTTVTLPTREEMKFEVTLPLNLTNFPEIRLTGKIDRCDLSDTGQLLQMVDYKTGKPKSRATITGQTKSSDGNYFRQLTFYVLLLSLHEDERLKTDRATLSFVEPTPKGEIKEESFTIPPEAVAGLKISIAEAIGAFLQGDFLYNEEQLRESGYELLARAWRERQIK